jgi:chromosome segregation ATPase
MGMKCCKKGLVVAAVLGVGVAALFATGYGRVAKKEVGAWFKKQIPPETQLKEVKDQISRMDRDIDAGWTPIAIYEREIKELREDLETKQARVKALEGELAKAADDLDGSIQKVKVAGPAETKKLKTLNDRTNLFIALKREVASKDKLLSAREQKLDAARNRQKALIAAKSKLMSEVAQMEADLEVLRWQQTESKLPVGDNSRLDDIKEKMRDLQNQITDQKRILELKQQYNPNTDAEEAAPTIDNGDSREVLLKKVREALGANEPNVASKNQ